MIDCFLRNSYACVLFERLSHVIYQESHVYSWNLGRIDLVHFWNFEISLVSLGRFFFFFFFQKSELGKFIPNFLLTHVITSTNISDKQIYLTSTSLVNIEKVSLPKGNRYLYLGVPPSSLKCMQGHMPKYKHLLNPGSVESVKLFKKKQ